MGGWAKEGDGRDVALSTGGVNKLTENYVASNNKIKRALGVDHLPVTAKDGLTKTIRSFENARG